MNDYANVIIKPFQVASDSKRRTEKRKAKDTEMRNQNTERRRPSFDSFTKKNKEKNNDLYKTVLYKIMTTRKQFIK